MMLNNRGQLSTNLPFILSIVLFFTTLTFVSVSMASANSGWLRYAPTSFTQPSCSLGIIVIDGLLTCAWNYLSAFLALMSISSEFAIFNGIILMGLIFSLGWAVVALLRGGGG